VRVAEPEPVVIILITFPTDGDVTAFAMALVGDGAAACVTVLPDVQSVYRWEGAIEQVRERQLIVKTTRDMVDRLRRRVADLHPYDTPEFLVLRVVGGEERYLAWIRDAVGAGVPTKADGSPQKVEPT
jgi:periplasmic divalent cation tolerance protein